jgi:predicted esterase
VGILFICEGDVDVVVVLGILPSRVVLAGFSQGAALSIWTGLQWRETDSPLGGVLALSGYLVKADEFIPTKQGRLTPVSMHHGGLDDVVRPEWGRLSHRALKVRLHPWHSGIIPPLISFSRMCRI